MGELLARVLVAVGMGGQEGGDASESVAAGARFEALLDQVDELRKRCGVPGVSIAVMEDGEIVLAVGLGVRRVGDERRVDAETLFQAGSISKPVAAAGALRMVADGRLALDGDVGEGLVSVDPPDGAARSGKAITLRGLLSHTAGISVHGFAGYLEGEEVPDLLDVLAGAPPANSPPIVVELEPGTKWQYSGGGYCVVQQLMIDVADQPFAPLLEALVFEPLGMAHSTYEQPLPADRRGNCSAGHAFPPKPLRGDAATHPELAAAGLWTTPSDLLRVGGAIQRAASGVDESFLPAALAREALMPSLSKEYGVGFQLFAPSGVPAFGHGGSNQGFKATLFMLRDRESGFALMTNGEGGGAMFARTIDLVTKSRGWVAAAPAEGAGQR